MNIIRKLGHSIGSGSPRKPCSSAGLRVCAPSRTASSRQRGQAMLEYALLVSVTVVFALGLLLSFNSKIRDGVFTFNVALERDLESGRLQNDSIWNEEF